MSGEVSPANPVHTPARVLGLMLKDLRVNRIAGTKAPVEDIMSWDKFKEQQAAAAPAEAEPDPERAETVDSLIMRAMTPPEREG
jgi:hypothetical protein